MSETYAHDADCNVPHPAGPEPCPPADSAFALLWEEYAAEFRVEYLARMDHYLMCGEVPFEGVDAGNHRSEARAWVAGGQCHPREITSQIGGILND